MRVVWIQFSHYIYKSFSGKSADSLPCTSISVLPQEVLPSPELQVSRDRIDVCDQYYLTEKQDRADTNRSKMCLLNPVFQWLELPSAALLRPSSSGHHGLSAARQGIDSSSWITCKLFQTEDPHIFVICSRLFPALLGLCSTAKQCLEAEGIQALCVLGEGLDRAWFVTVVYCSCLALNPCTALPQATIWHSRAWKEGWEPLGIWWQFSVVVSGQSWSLPSLDPPVMGALCWHHF